MGVGALCCLSFCVSSSLSMDLIGAMAPSTARKKLCLNLLLHTPSCYSGHHLQSDPPIGKWEGRSCSNGRRKSHKRSCEGLGVEWDLSPPHCHDAGEATFLLNCPLGHDMQPHLCSSSTHSLKCALLLCLGEALSQLVYLFCWLLINSPSHAW